MKTITIESIPTVNLAALDQDLRDQLGAGIVGVSYTDKTVMIHLDEQVNSAQIEAARASVRSHDSSRLTPLQQAENARKAKLEQTRRDFGAADIDVAVYGTQSALIQKLAQKIAWLEQEVLEKRGGSRG